jgi:GDPmannose 4,6-dehydratase
MLEATRNLAKRKEVRFYQASSSEMFGSASPPQNENTPFAPRSPYACAKAMAFRLAENYREAYDLFVCNGILFNNESERRGETFVTRKITMAVANIYKGNQKHLYLGNLHSKRDWGHANDYVDAIYKMMHHDKPDDYVVATGETHSIKEFLITAFDHVGLDWEDFVKIDERYFRPTEVDILQGDSTKIREELGWTPKVSFMELVELMVEHDLHH